MDLYHLSHTDLDGYGCQLVTRFLQGKIWNKSFYYNANYGKEVMMRIFEMSDMIYESDCEKVLFLISDLNLSLDECRIVEEEIEDLRMEGKNVDLQVLDHHLSGQESAQNYQWYFLDNDRCATKITYDFFKQRYGEILDKDHQWLSQMVEVINAIDLWKEDSSGFEMGKVLMRMIVETKEVNRLMFDNAHRDYKMDMLIKSSHFLGQKDGHIALDNAVHTFKKEILGGSALSDTLDNIASAMQVDLLCAKREECEIYCDGYRGFLSYGIGNISVLANAFLKRCKEFDFFIDVGMRGSVSLRSCDRCDVSEMAKVYFNGGGHKNASGGRIDGFKESFLYRDVKESVVKILRGSAV
ncbi:phosphoesterase [Helicobacter monodelphidis]|uniref:DHH family phosphoesterase n=1 Tax=Helicobacter sp. 15-1451 TaxID=2004995 RepID=UPI000DCCB161|nr:3',5'-cyclic-nucleotide phosphodiesterase [Helicobacter sp. 15-1451]RAX58194.1 phosphoesterase [Helicobacter sp. 15-1451]